MIKFKVFKKNRNGKNINSKMNSKKKFMMAILA